MNIRSFRAAGAVLVLGLGAAAPAAWADPPSWAPAHGYRAKHQYDYVYYPQQEVYYSPEKRLWFWASGSNWLRLCENSFYDLHLRSILST